MMLDHKHLKPHQGEITGREARREARRKTTIKSKQPSHLLAQACQQPS